MLAPSPEFPAKGAWHGSVLEARGLTLDYEGERGTVRAVENVSFTLPEGGRLVLLGPSGCGKSSILKAAAGFLKPSAGTLLLNGAPVTGPGPDRIVVFQEFDQLLPWKSVLDNVAFPLRVALKLPLALAREKAAAALHRVGLTRALDQYPHALSGGMKQRAAIARALAMEPAVLLMDEPFAALDALTRLQMQRDLLEIAQERSLTLLFVTHAIDEAVLLGTRLHLLSTQPGRTLARFETTGFEAADIGTPRFEDAVRQVHAALFDPREGAR